MQARVLKWGNSLAVKIPKAVAEDAQLKVGDPLEIAIGADGVLEVHRVGEIPTLAQLLDRITPENRYAEISLGPEIGREAVEWSATTFRIRATSCSGTSIHRLAENRHSKFRFGVTVVQRV